MVLLIQLPYCSRPVTIIAVVFARRRAVLLRFFHLFVFVFSGRLLGVLLCRRLSSIMFFFLSGFFVPLDMVALLLLAAARLLSWSGLRRSCLIVWIWHFIRRDEITRGVLVSYGLLPLGGAAAEGTGALCTTIGGAAAGGILFCRSVDPVFLSPFRAMRRSYLPVGRL